MKSLLLLAALIPAITLGAMPDLTITQAGFSTGALSATALNVGDAPTSATRSVGVVFYVDGKKVATALTMSPIAAGETATLVGKYPLPPGVHDLAVQVDDLGLIDESDETNNWLHVATYLAPPPTPTPTPTPAPTPTPTPVPTPPPVLAQIAADMGPSDAPGHGIESWAPSKGGIVEYALPAGYNAWIGWGCVYRDTTDSPDTNTRVAIRNYRSYLLDKAGKWTLVSNPANASISGRRWPENFGGATLSNATRVEADGSLSQKLAHGYNWHFFTPSRAQVDPAAVDGVLTLFDARLVVDNPAQADDRATAKYLFASGADWWRSLTAAHIAYNKDPALTNAAEIGWSKLKRVTSEWQTVRFTNIPTATLAKYPPPIQ